MKRNVQVTADTIYTSKQFQRIKDNFDVSRKWIGNLQYYYWAFVGKKMAENGGVIWCNQDWSFW